MMFDSAIYPQDDFKLDDDGKSEIQQMFNDTTVFITGVTGFLGKLLLEKLLRRCRGIKKIYVLVRSKKQDYTKRLDTIFEQIIFNDIKENYKHVMQKVCIMHGDLTKPDLGLSEQDQRVIISEVDFIFHVAATIRFDEKMRTAAYINVRATLDLLKLAQQGSKSKVFVHVSTAFSFPMIQGFKEVWYKTKMKAEDLLNLVSTLDDKQLETLTPSLLGEWPNTYTYTKAITEDLICRHAGKLHYAVVRPSVVISTAKEPICGWIDSFAGFTSLYVGVDLGLIHTVQADLSATMEIVPADYVINNMIAASWWSKSNKNNGIYNFVNTPQNSISADQGQKMISNQQENIPSVHKKWYTFKIITKNYYTFIVLHYLFHVLTGYMIDLGCILTGKSTFAVKAYKQVSKQLHLFNYFTRTTFNFSSTNTQRLWKSLSTKDKQLFNFDMETHDWEQQSVPYAYGIRVYLLKDPLSTVPQAMKLKKKLAVVHYTLVFVLLLILFYFFIVLFKCIQNKL